MDKKSNLVSHLMTITDPRKDINKKHNLIDILFIAICATLSGCEGWEDIELFAKTKIDWLKKFLELPNGIPSHDRIRYVFMNIDSSEFEKAFRDWVLTITRKYDKEIIAIDGKTSCCSYDKKHGKKALHMVSAWGLENKLVMGQVKTYEKSNEITAIPELLDFLDVEGGIVTIDAMGCQKKIVKKINEKKADYVIATKKNQERLYSKIEVTFEELILDKCENRLIEDEKTSHGRQEKREYYLCKIPGHFNEECTWDNFNSIGMVASETLRDGQLSKQVRYYISSLKENQINDFSRAVRGHWGVENSLHWQLDVSFNEDKCRKRSKNAAENFSILRRICLNLLKKETSAKRSIKNKQRLCGWDYDYLVKVLFSL